MNIALRRRVFSSRVALVAALAVLAATGEFVSGQSTRPPANASLSGPRCFS